MENNDNYEMEFMNQTSNQNRETEQIADLENKFQILSSVTDSESDNVSPNLRIINRIKKLTKEVSEMRDFYFQISKSIIEPKKYGLYSDNLSQFTQNHKVLNMVLLKITNLENRISLLNNEVESVQK